MSVRVGTKSPPTYHKHSKESKEGDKNKNQADSALDHQSGSVYVGEDGCKMGVSLVISTVNSLAHLRLRP